MSKLLYSCITCFQQFNNKEQLKRHYLRRRGCKSPDDVLTEVLLKKIQQLERNMEEYRFFKFEGTAMNMLNNRYDRLYRIKDSLDAFEVFLKTHLKNAYDTEVKRKVVQEIYDDLVDEYKVLKDEYKTDRNLFISKKLDI